MTAEEKDRENLTRVITDFCCSFPQQYKDKIRCAIQINCFCITFENWIIYDMLLRYNILPVSLLKCYFMIKIYLIIKLD